MFTASIFNRKQQRFSNGAHNMIKHGGTVLVLALLLLSIAAINVIKPAHSAGALTAYDPTDTVNVPGCKGQAECFAFSIDTALDASGGHTGTSTTFTISTSGAYDWIIDWGDNTGDQIYSGSSSTGISYTYATAGPYQITIRPNGTATAGWMDAFGSPFRVDYMFLSIDTPLTNLMRTQGAASRFAFMFYGDRNAIGIPDNLFSNIVTTSDTDFTSMFAQTFYNYAYNSTTATIPAGLFSSIDTSSGTNFRSMFSGTFANYAYNSATATIPAGLFSSIDTSSGTVFREMFQQTFNNYAYNSTTATIPAGLFDSIDTGSGTDFSNMFGGTFLSYAYNSTVGTIPAGLFDTIDTGKGTDFTYMFMITFNNYARRSANFSVNGSIVTTSSVFQDPYTTKNVTAGGLPNTSPINPGDKIVPSYNNNDRTITAPTGTYASYNWYRTDGTSCAVAHPTPDCGAWTADHLVTFPVTDEWTPETSTEKGNVTFYGGVPTLATVSFDSNGGSTVPGQTVNVGSMIDRPTDPIKAGFSFAGWFTNPGLTIPWDFKVDTVSGDLTLYAKWTEATTPPVIPGVPDTGILW